jgi:glycosyltransferase involved in cell wall biosynthesis
VKFSALLPTRNRLEYLRFAVDTVRRQDYDDWEIVISDNASDQDIRGWVESLHDGRIKYLRTDRFLPVTDNWNRSLDNSTGDWVIMLGDDDGLMPGYFRRAASLIAKFGQPDLIYTSGYLYAYPGVLPDHPEGLLNHYRNASFLRAASAPFWLPSGKSRRLVSDSLDFKMRFTYNMQYSLISRGLINAMLRDGPFFQSPFPDYYATNVMFLKASKILIDPEPMVAIGITPKSYGFFLFNNREVEGVDFLQTDEMMRVAPPKHKLLPGTNMNTSWLLAMEVVAANYGLRLNYDRYRRLQIMHVLRGRVDGHIADNTYRELTSQMHPWERVTYGTALAAVATAMKVLRGRPRTIFRRSVRRLEKWIRASNEWQPPAPTRRYANMIEVFEGAAADRHTVETR